MNLYDFLKIALLIFCVLFFLKKTFEPMIYRSINAKDMTRFLHTLYFRGYISNNSLKDGRILLSDRNSGQKYEFKKYEEMGVYGIFFVVKVNEKRIDIEEMLAEQELEYYYDVSEDNGGGYKLYIDIRNKLNMGVPLLFKLADDEIAAITTGLNFNLKFINVSPDPDDFDHYNQEDEELLNRVKMEIRIPTLKVIWFIAVIRMLIIGR